MKKFFSNSKTPGFSDFRNLMDRWDVFCEKVDLDKKLDDILDKHELILFFKKGKELFGATEESRVIFAKLKTDTEDDPMMPGFRQEARFPAINLYKAMSNDPESSLESVFSIKDLPKIKVVSREDAVELLKAPRKK
jgi:hypothetical protein